MTFIVPSIATLVAPSIFYLILIPLIGVFVILFTNNNKATILYNIALFFSLLNLFVSVVMWYFFDNSTSVTETVFNTSDTALSVEMPITNIEGVGAALATGSSLQFQFIFEINHFSFGVDGISLFFVLLTTFITPIAIFSSYELYGYSKSNSVTVNVNSHQHSLLEVNINKEDKPSAGQWQGQETIKLKIFLISLLLLESLQICAFVSLDLLLFYIFFESAKWSGTLLLCLQLSNSGDSLKLIVPNYSQKAICGWSNYSGTVTSYKISENKMGNRGSKSIVSLNKIKNTFVKEQRVDGSYFGYNSILNPKLRCTLRGCESNYQISNPSNQFIIQGPRGQRSFHSHSKKLVHQTFTTKTQNSILLPTKESIIKPKLIESNILEGVACKAVIEFMDNKNKSLVEFGSRQNLSSTLGIRFSRTQLAMVKLAPYQQSVIIGLLLSDGWLTSENKKHKNAALGFEQSLAKVRYILFVFNLLSHYCSKSPHFKIKTRLGIRSYSLTLYTRSMPCLTELRSVFYLNGVKILPFDIYNMLTPVALAHMIMGDGSSQRHGLTICTDSLTLKDIVRLINVLIIRYRLVCSLRQHSITQTRIYIKQSSMPLLRTIVIPHMCSSMLYKLEN